MDGEVCGEVVGETNALGLEGVSVQAQMAKSYTWSNPCHQAPAPTEYPSDAHLMLDQEGVEMAVPESSGDYRVCGVIPIVYTPFDVDGRIDEEDLERLVDHLIDSGAHGLAASGGASEAHKMPVDERKWLVERTIALAHGRVPVIVGTSATNTAESVELSQHAEAVGAAAVFLTPPLFGPLTDESLRHHYGAVAQSTNVPIMVQDANVSVSPTQIVSLAKELPTVRYAKEESPLESGHRISEIKRLRPQITVLSGGSFMLDDLARGAEGAIPGSLGIADLSKAYERYASGDLAAARAAYDHFTPLSFWRRQFPLIGAKEVLRRIGIFKQAHLREPKGATLDEQDHRELSAIMERMGPPF